MTLAADFNVWDGIYAAFSDAPAAGPGFAGETWQERSLQSARQALLSLTSDKPLDYSLRQRNALLPMICAMVLEQKKRIRILDFGGGLGAGYIMVLRALPGAAGQIDYCIVETEGICSRGSKLFSQYEGITFARECPPEAEFDVVYSASALQYLEDWRGVVGQLARYRAPHFVLADAFVGEFPSYVTLQNYYESRIPHWFLNRNDLEKAVAGHGYSLMLRMDCDAKILGEYGPLPMTNFPPELRINFSSHLLFRFNRNSTSV
jgi:putative methyltransferase (TIGR04325 family)